MTSLITKPKRNSLMARTTRTIFSTDDRLNRRGVRARASSWGWCWISSRDGATALYVSAGVPESAGITPRAKVALHAHALALAGRNADDVAHTWKALIHETQKQSPSVTFHRCIACGYSEASLIDSPTHQASFVCVACRIEATAIHALAVQEESGVNLGWRSTDAEFSHDGYAIPKFTGLGQRDCEGFQTQAQSKFRPEIKGSSGSSPGG